MIRRLVLAVAALLAAAILPQGPALAQREAKPFVVAPDMAYLLVRYPLRKGNGGYWYGLTLVRALNDGELGKYRAARDAGLAEYRAKPASNRPFRFNYRDATNVFVLSPGKRIARSATEEIYLMRSCRAAM